MQAHSPAGGAPAGHGGGLSPSDPALSLLCLGDTGTSWPRSGSYPGVFPSIAEPV